MVDVPLQRTLIVAPQPLAEDRGTPIAVRYVATALAEAGWQVDLLTYKVGADVTIPGVNVIRFGNSFGRKTVPIGLSLAKLLMDTALPWALHCMPRRWSA